MNTYAGEYRNPTMLHVFSSKTRAHTEAELKRAVDELNDALEEYLSDKPGLLVAGVGQLYFHLGRYPVETGEGAAQEDCFTMFLPVMFSTLVEEDE